MHHFCLRQLSAASSSLFSVKHGVDPCYLTVDLVHKTHIGLYFFLAMSRSLKAKA